MLTTHGLFSFVSLHPFAENNNIDPKSFGAPTAKARQHIWKSVSYIPLAELHRLQYPYLGLYLMGNGIVLAILAVICWFVADAIYKLRKADTVLTMEREKFRTVADFTYDWEYWLSEKGELIYISPSCKRITGYSAQSFIDNPELLTSLIHPDDWPDVAIFFDKEQLSQGVCQIDFRIRTADGKEKWIAHSSQPVFNEKGVFWGRRASNADITERKNIELQLENLASHDVLTQLPNRKLLYEYMTQILATSKREQRKVAVLFLDLDNFKQVNDVLGHDAGDSLLKVVSRGMKSVLREGDVVARVGGDEFIVVLPDLNDFQDSKPIGQKLLKKITQMIELTLGNTSLAGTYVGVSIGISVYPDHAEDIEGLIKVADQNMYHSKRAGKNRVFLSETHSYPL